MCMGYCDRLLKACKNDFFDHYADKGTTVPLCKDDSLICSQISEVVTTGPEFCEMIGLPVSTL